MPMDVLSSCMVPVCMLHNAADCILRKPHKHLLLPYTWNLQNADAVRYAPGVDLACLRRLLKATELSCKAGTWPICIPSKKVEQLFLLP